MNSDNPVVSVIIVTYNNASEIEACLFSLEKINEHLPLHIIIIENNSNDRTLEIVVRNVSRFEDVRIIINDRNLGFTRAVNQGLEIADGEYLLLLNPDTILPADALSVLLLKLHENSRLGIIAPQFLNSDGSIQPSCRRFPRHIDVFYSMLGLNNLFARSRHFNGWKMGDFDHQTARFVDQPQGAFLLTPRKAYAEVGLMDESFTMFFSDVDWCRRFIEGGWKILFSPDVKIIHHKGRSVFQNRATLIWSSHVSFYDYFKKYYHGAFWTVVNVITSFVLMALALIRIIFTLIK